MIKVLLQGAGKRGLCFIMGRRFIICLCFVVYLSFIINGQAWPFIIMEKGGASSLRGQARPFIIADQRRLCFIIGGASSYTYALPYAYALLLRASAAFHHYGQERRFIIARQARPMLHHREALHHMSMLHHREEALHHMPMLHHREALHRMPMLHHREALHRMPMLHHCGPRSCKATVKPKPRPQISTANQRPIRSEAGLTTVALLFIIYSW